MKAILAKIKGDVNTGKNFSSDKRRYVSGGIVIKPRVVLSEDNRSNVGGIDLTMGAAESSKAVAKQTGRKCACDENQEHPKNDTAQIT